MTQNHTNHSAVLLLLVLALSMPLFAVPRVVMTSLSQGTTLLRHGNEVAQVNWTIDNPDTELAEITLQVNPAYGDTSCIYSTVTAIPPRTRLSGSAYFLANAADAYTVEGIWEGKVIYKDQIMAKATTAPQFSVAVLNDGYTEGGLSKVQKLPYLTEKVYATGYTAVNAPMHWCAFQDYAIILLLEPDFNRYSNLQINAILDYVSMGGTLFLCSPALPQLAKGTLLEQIMPLLDAGSAIDDDFSALARIFQNKSWKPSSQYDEAGYQNDIPTVPRFNGVPREGSSILLSDARQPGKGEGNIYGAVKPYGCGKVVQFTFNPIAVINRDESFTAPIWEFIIQNGGHTPGFMKAYDTASANETLQMLQGYSIPPVSTIVWILLIYIVGCVAILFYTFRLKRQVLGWLSVCAYGLCMTVLTLALSSGISRSQAELSTANISLCVWNGSRGAEKNNSMFLSQGDLKCALSAPIEQIFLQRQPSRPQSGGEGAMGSGTLWITNGARQIGAEKMSLQKMRPRTLLWLRAGRNHVENKSELPTMVIEGDGIRLNDWSLPPELQNSKRAFLATKCSIRPLSIASNAVHDTGEKAMVEADTVLLSAMKYVLEQRRQCPVLVLVSQNPAGKQAPLQPVAGDASSTMQDYDLLMVPVRYANGGIASEKPDVVPFDVMDWMIPAHSALKTAFTHGHWQNVTMSSETNFITNKIRFIAPPQLTLPSPDAIEILADATLPTSDAEICVKLEACDGSVLEAVKSDGRRFIFLPQGKQVISPATGSFAIQLSAVVKRSSIDSFQTLPRGNYWSMNTLEARIINREKGGSAQ